MDTNIRISVRSLVEFILRSGDIDNRRGAMADKDAMQMGSRLHRKIQGRMGANYRAEVPLSATFPCGDFFITVEGRADGIIVEEEADAPEPSEDEERDAKENLPGRRSGKTEWNPSGFGREQPKAGKVGKRVTIDEIKGIYRGLETLREPVPVHLAQAKCYAYIYAAQEQLGYIDVQMTYANLETEEIRRFREEYEFEELEEWFFSVLDEYKKWAAWQMEWRRIRQESIRKVAFPFPYREGQRDLAAAVYRTIARKKKLFIQAPTGVGKTISTVFPAVKAVGEELGDKIFYLTAKTIARTVAEEAFALLAEQGLRYKVVTLTAKEKICACEEAECNPDYCPRAKGHFDRINDAVYEMITTQTAFTREAMENWAERWNVCPFELSLDVSLWVDAVICDYNYVFDPRAHLKRFFAEGARGDYLFLIDEAHNLVERAREMYSAQLCKEDFLELKRAVKNDSRRMAAALERCNRHFLAMKRECENYQVLGSPGVLPISLMNLSGIMEEFLEDSKNQSLNDQVLDLYFQVSRFLDTCDRLDECYVTYSEIEEDGRFRLKLFCVDPSVNLQRCLDKGNAAIFFSATLLPIDYYKSLLSTARDDYAIYANSCFDRSRKQILIGADTSSRYTNRTEREYRKIADYILRTVLARKGNYLVFFSSYRMLDDVSECFVDICPEDIRIMCQTSRMTEAEREKFLEEFSEENDRSLVGFCVMGSIFGEGIDLKKDRLIGAVVVGTGLPQVCNEREILKNYYDARGRDGFRYAYLCPGMNKVLQAAGRVIRTEEDRGVILLLDERFNRYQYRQMFPREWSDYEVCTLENVQEKVSAFWGC